MLGAIISSVGKAMEKPKHQHLQVGVEIDMATVANPVVVSCELNVGVPYKHF